MTTGRKPMMTTSTRRCASRAPPASQPSCTAPHPASPPSRRRLRNRRRRQGAARSGLHHPRRSRPLAGHAGGGPPPRRLPGPSRRRSHEAAAARARSYDAVLSAGTFTLGHVNAGPLRALVGLVRPKGLLAFVVGSGFWSKGGFETAIARLTAGRAVELLHCAEEPIAAGGQDLGWFVVLRRPGDVRSARPGPS